MGFWGFGVLGERGRASAGVLKKTIKDSPLGSAGRPGRVGAGRGWKPQARKARRRRWRRRRRGFRSAEFAPRVVVGGGELLSVRGPAVDRACGRENPASAASAARRAACGGYVVGQDRSGLALPVSRRRYPRRQRHLVVRGDAAAAAAAASVAD